MPSVRSHGAKASFLAGRQHWIQRFWSPATIMQHKDFRDQLWNASGAGFVEVRIEPEAGFAHCGWTEVLLLPVPTAGKWLYCVGVCWGPCMEMGQTCQAAGISHSPLTQKHTPHLAMAFSKTCAHRKIVFCASDEE
ncbi:UNVERIFIED_CONTAM: hypothetical protein K2H54_028854 [Gekko kuhli]